MDLLLAPTLLHSTSLCSQRKKKVSWQSIPFWAWDVSRTSCFKVNSVENSEEGEGSRQHGQNFIFFLMFGWCWTDDECLVIFLSCKFWGVWFDPGGTWQMEREAGGVHHNNMTSCLFPAFGQFQQAQSVQPPPPHPPPPQLHPVQKFPFSLILIPISPAHIVNLITLHKMKKKRIQEKTTEISSSLVSAVLAEIKVVIALVFVSAPLTCGQISLCVHDVFPFFFFLFFGPFLGVCKFSWWFEGKWLVSWHEKTGTEKCLLAHASVTSCVREQDVLVLLLTFFFVLPHLFIFTNFESKGKKLIYKFFEPQKTSQSWRDRESFSISFPNTTGNF